MGLLDETRNLERLQFFNGQRLFASDLQGLEAFNREMRWLHNQSLHQPGIGNGFEVLGEKGDREVTINPGYAIDNEGREIVLTNTHVEPVPPVSSEADGSPVFFDLTVSYPEDDALEEAETREGICLPRGVVRLQEKPLFCWVRLAKDNQENLEAKDPKLAQDIKNGQKIVLARLEVLNCQLNDRLSITQRRNARPAKQPYIACGKLQPTNWEIWEFDPNNPASNNVSLPIECPSVLPFGLKVEEIDTRTAGFATTPCYSVRIAGERYRTEIVIDNSGSGYLPAVIDGLVNIVDPKPNSFGIRVLLIVQPFSADTAYGASIEKEDARKLADWHIVWMGVEG